MINNLKIVPVILCGGSGTRLWPASRDSYPKQFLTLIGEGSLLQQTLQRAMNISSAKADHVVTVTSGALKPEVMNQLGAIDKGATNHILCEPSARNTAAAIALAASYIADTFGTDALMWVLPADHHIGNEAILETALEAACQAAAANFLVTFGIQPTRAETGYGYIRMGDDFASETMGHVPGMSEVQEFIEKPDLHTAKAYFSSGDYLWNSGMFLFSAGTVLAKFAQYSPKILDTVRLAMAAGTGTEPAADIYALIDDQPFDKAIMEKTSRVVVIPCNPSWSDIGSWESLWELRDKDHNGNVTSGFVVCQNSHNCLIETSGKRLIACAGLEHIAVIDTGDAILIADLRKSDAIKSLVKTIKQSGVYDQLSARPENAVSATAKKAA